MLLGWFNIRNLKYPPPPQKKGKERKIEKKKKERNFALRFLLQIHSHRKGFATE